jgi:hypothetical protein
MTYLAIDVEQAFGLTGVVLQNGVIIHADGLADLTAVNERLQRARAAGTLAVPRLPDAEAYQVREWLIKQGIGVNTVEVLLEQNISDPTQLALAKSRWEYATRVPREHPLTVGIGQALGMTPSELDEAWVDLLTY